MENDRSILRLEEESLSRRFVFLILFLLSLCMAGFAQSDSGSVQTGSTSAAEPSVVQPGQSTVAPEPSLVQTESESIAASVNGESITKAELQAAAGTNRVLQSLFAQFPRFAQALLTTPEGEALLDAYELQILDQIVESRLLVQAAVKAEVTVDETLVEEEVEARTQGILEQNQLTTEELEQILTQQGSSLDEYKARLRKAFREQGMVEALRLKVTEDVTVPDAEVAAYYEEHQNEFKDKDGKAQPLTDVQEEIRKYLLADAQDRAFSDWFAGAKAQARIEIYL